MRLLLQHLTHHNVFNTVIRVQIDIFLLYTVALKALCFDILHSPNVLNLAGTSLESLGNRERSYSDNPSDKTDGLEQQHK